MINSYPRVHLTRAGGSGEDETYALDHGVAMIGFREYPSLADPKDYHSILALVKAAGPELKPRAAGNHAGPLWAFTLAMQPGHLVVLPRKLTSQVALGRVTGPYKYEKIDGEPRHTRAVDWVRPDVARSAFRQDLLYSFGKAPKPESAACDAEDAPLDFGQGAHDQIVAHIQTRFSGHSLARLVDTVLTAEGRVTKLSPPGVEGGVDTLVLPVTRARVSVCSSPPKTSRLVLD